MKHVDITDVETAAVPLPIKMSRKEKLLRWAMLLRSGPSRWIILYSGLEYWPPRMLRDIHPRPSEDSAFAIAMSDDIFRQEGLPQNPSLMNIMDFFELSQGQLHEFSCDCGGSISNTDAAARIERLAG